MIDYSVLADSYDSQYKSEMSKRENQAIKKVLDEYIKPETNVLDIGCGTGFVLDLIGDPERINRTRYLGVDISEKMIEKAREKYPHHHFIPHDFSELDFRSDFDVALCLFSIPYTGETLPDKLLDMLKDDGICICVYYDKPYRNRDSVYARNKLKYMCDVRQKVKRVEKRFTKLYDVILKEPLIEEKTYTIAVFKKRASGGIDGEKE